MQHSGPLKDVRCISIINTATPFSLFFVTEQLSVENIPCHFTQIKDSDVHEIQI